MAEKIGQVGIVARVHITPSSRSGFKVVHPLTVERPVIDLEIEGKEAVDEIRRAIEGGGIIRLIDQSHKDNDQTYFGRISRALAELKWDLHVEYFGAKAEIQLFYIASFPVEAANKRNCLATEFI